jgi:cytochrome c biogenesis protein CcmG/thiol:disulfide interchange protein DsbE
MKWQIGLGEKNHRGKRKDRDNFRKFNHEPIFNPVGGLCQRNLEMSESSHYNRMQLPNKLLVYREWEMPRRFLRFVIFIAMMNLILLGPVVLSLAKVLNQGDKAPLFALESVQGQKVDLAQHIGSEVIVLGLFHICEPCMNQAMELETLIQSFKGKKILVVGVNASGDPKPAVLEYLNSFPQKVSFPYLVDPARTVEGLFSVKVTPIVYIIDRQGIIRFKGSSVPAQILQKEVSKLLS